MTDALQMAVLGAVALSCGLVGPFLVLKRMTQFANSLTHTILLGVTGSYLLASSLWGGGFFDIPTLLIGAAIAALITAFLTEGLVRLFHLQEDASIGLVFTALFALGVVAITVFTRDVHLGVETVMGNADILQFADFWFAAALALVNGAAVIFFFRHFQLASFDRSTGKFHFLFLFLVAITCIGAFRAVGPLLVLAFLTGPYLTARLFCHRLQWLLVWSPLLGIATSILGVLTTRLCLDVFGLPISTGGTIAVLIGIVYAIALCLKRLTQSATIPTA